MHMLMTVKYGGVFVKVDVKKLLICIAIPLLVGGLSGFLSAGEMEAFEQLKKPTLSPPGWLFPVVWTILYTLMGISSYLVLTSGQPKETIKMALAVYGIQLAVNFTWSLLFFNLEAYLAAFIWLLYLWLLILVMIYQFYKISKPAGILMIPYLLWVTFAGYLNLGIYLLNR